MQKTIILFLVFLFPLLAKAKTDFSGAWNTSFGFMELKQEGNKITGHYIMEKATCTLSGELTANGRFVFSYKEPNAQGEAWFELKNNGEIFEGQ